VRGDIGYLVEDRHGPVPFATAQAEAGEAECGTGLRTVSPPDRFIATLSVVKIVQLLVAETERQLRCVFSWQRLIDLGKF
jgi:hypothetical protein